MELLIVLVLACALWAFLGFVAVLFLGIFGVSITLLQGIAVAIVFSMVISVLKRSK